jgi:hypothetical protein
MGQNIVFNRSGAAATAPAAPAAALPLLWFFCFFVFLFLQNKLLLSHSQIEFYFSSLFFCL